MAAIPDLAIIGGTGLNNWLGEPLAQHQYQTPYGEPSAPLSVYGLASNARVALAFMPRHGSPHNIPPHRINYRANLWALKEAGVKRVIAVNAVGGIHADMGAGVIAVPHQLIDYSYGREHTFADGTEGAVLQHVDFTWPFDESLRQALLSAALSLGISVQAQAVYGVVQGPRLETAAEIDRMEGDGCDLVGMTAMPEAALARELGLEYASICLVVNPAAGRSDQPITLEDIQRVVEQGMGLVQRIIASTAQALQ